MAYQLIYKQQNQKNVFRESRKTRQKQLVEKQLAGNTLFDNNLMQI